MPQKGAFLMPSEKALAMMQRIADSNLELTQKIDCHLRIFFPKFAAAGIWHSVIMKLVLAVELGRDLNQEIEIPDLATLLNKEHPTMQDILEFFQVTQYINGQEV